MSEVDANAEQSMSLGERIVARGYINPHTIQDDVKAGLVLGIESVPDGLAQGFLALVNPIFGLYGYMMGTFTGAFFTSSVYMTIQAPLAPAIARAVSIMVPLGIRVISSTTSGGNCFTYS